LTTALSRSCSCDIILKFPQALSTRLTHAGSLAVETGSSSGMVFFWR